LAASATTVSVRVGYRLDWAQGDMIGARSRIENGLRVNGLVASRVPGADTEWTHEDDEARAYRSPPQLSSVHPWQ
jgi:hypothetical protein